MNYEPRLSLPFDTSMAHAMASVIASVGQPEFFERALELLGHACRMDSGGVMLFYRHQRPRRLVHRFNLERKIPEGSYLDGPYALDPSYQLFLRGVGDGVYWLRDVAPDDFFESEYHRLFYSQIGLSDTIDVMWRVDADTALLYFVERSARNPAFQAADVAALNLLLPCVVAASGRHHHLTRGSAPTEADTVTHRKVESTIANFARSLLTKREREVLFYMLSGYSSALTAEKLETSEGTIKIHRKNIHRKLDIGSQAELFSLFVQCIPFAVPEEEVDPLQAYQSKPGQRRSVALLPPEDADS